MWLDNKDDTTGSPTTTDNNDDLDFDELQLPISKRVYLTQEEIDAKLKKNKEEGERWALRSAQRMAPIREKLAKVYQSSDDLLARCAKNRAGHLKRMQETDNLLKQARLQHLSFVKDIQRLQRMNQMSFEAKRL